jgi:hypothetical protein
MHGEIQGRGSKVEELEFGLSKRRLADADPLGVGGNEGRGTLEVSLKLARELCFCSLRRGRRVEKDEVTALVTMP